MRRVPSGAHIFPLPLGTLCFPTASSTHSLSASRLLHPKMSQADSMFPFSHNELVAALSKCHEPAPVLIASRIHSSRSPFHGGVIFYSLSSTSSCASLLSRQLGSPAWSFQSSSAMVTPLLLTPVVPSLLPLALSKFSSSSSMLVLRPTPPRVASVGVPTRWHSVLWTPCASTAMSTLLPRLLTSKRLLTPAGLKPLWFVSLMSVSRVVCGTCLQISFVAPCPRSVWVALSPPWVDSGMAQGRILSPLLFNLLVDSLATTLRAAIPGVPLVASDPFHHVCQHYADDLVFFTASQADLQVALDAVHAWGVRWLSLLVSAVMTFGPLRSRPDCCVHLDGVPLPLVGCCSLSHPFLAWISSLLALIDSSTRPIPGALVKVSSLLFVVNFHHQCSLQFIGDDPPALQQFNLALRRSCRHLLGLPSASPVAAVH